MQRREACLPGSVRRRLARAMIVTLMLALPTGAAFAQAAQQPDSWPDLKQQLFSDRSIHDGSEVVSIDAPYRAEDAAVVPVTIRVTLPPNDGREVRRLTLLVDENPSPLAATITFGPHSSLRTLTTNMRVNSYTNLHLVAELSDGMLYAIKRFVKAAGGCSAPALKQADDTIPLGTMRFHVMPTRADGRLPEAQVMIRHPNYSGMQMDQVTRMYTPAHFVKTVQVFQEETLLFAIDSGISIAENPLFRFDFDPTGGLIFRIEAADSEGGHFQKSFVATLPPS